MSTLQTTATADYEQRSGSDGFGWLAVAGISLVSVIYFADMVLRAGHKCFWFDELFTVYLCRLPSFTGTWSAVMHGVDFNPPLFYLLTRGAQRLFGEGLIATRLPAMVGVWDFCICLFFFVARRAGMIPGFIAGVFPFFTLAQYYAYEARAHGILLGWCGLALVCWQRNAEGRAKYLWLGGFGLSILGALLTHVYAVYLLVPFAVVEIYNLIDRRRPNWGLIAVMLLVLGPVTLAVYLPLFRAYHATMPSNFFLVSHDVFQRFLGNVIGPATIIFVLSILLFALAGARRDRPTHTTAILPRREILLAAGFICIPIVGVIGCKVSHGPFLDRYFLSSIAGYAIILGFAHSPRQVSSWTARALAGSMFFLMVADLGTTVYFSMADRLLLAEPSTGLALSTNPAHPMRMYEALSLDDSGLDVLVLPSLEYIHFFRYAPPSIVSRLYFAAPPNNTNFGGYERLKKWTHTDLKTTTFDSFLATHSRFLVYESAKGADTEAVEAFARDGYKIRSARSDIGGTLYEYAK
jgi:hypothetical protein